MNKAIVYSLFGYDRERAENCFDFNSYLRGLMLCIRFNRLIYPDWQTILETDHSTYSGFEPLFKGLEDRNVLRIEKNKNDAQLCEAMLWRLKPAFWKDASHKWEFSHVLCRDLDSPATYREAQAVQVWMNHDKAMHAITDSVSHTLPLLGGMIGLRPDYFSGRMNVNSFSDFMGLCRHDLSAKGSDQTFLNQIVYPNFAEKGRDSITQHYILGYGQTWLSDWHNTIEDIPLSISEELKETNVICGHIGAAGWYEPPMMKLIYKYKHKFEDFLMLEKMYPQIFYWA